MMGRCLASFVFTKLCCMFIMELCNMIARLSGKVPALTGPSFFCFVLAMLGQIY